MPNLPIMAKLPFANGGGSLIGILKWDLPLPALRYETTDDTCVRFCDREQEQLLTTRILDFFQIPTNRST